MNNTALILKQERCDHRTTRECQRNNCNGYKLPESTPVAEIKRMTLQEIVEEVVQVCKEHAEDGCFDHEGAEANALRILESRYASQLVPIQKQNPDKEHFDKQLLKELAWKLDREVWAHVPNPDPSEPWTQSKAREVTRELIAEYIGDYDKMVGTFCLKLAPPIQQRNFKNGCEIQCQECRKAIEESEKKQEGELSGNSEQVTN